MVAFIGNTLRGKVSGESFDESIATRQNSSDFSPVKVLHYMIYGCVPVCMHTHTCVCVFGCVCVCVYSYVSVHADKT